MNDLTAFEATFSAHSNQPAMRALYSIYRGSIDRLRNDAGHLRAIHEERWAAGLESMANGLEIIGLRHMRVVLARSTGEP